MTGQQDNARSKNPFKAKWIKKMLSYKQNRVFVGDTLTKY